MRRRDFAAEAQQRRSQPKKLIDLHVAVESALKGGWCPSCGNRFGRSVRIHFQTCGASGNG